MSILSEQLLSLGPRIEERSHSILAELANSIAPSEQVTPLLEICHKSLEEGKRFRAFLAFVGGSLFTHTPIETLPLDDLGASLELYQASALVHDDIIDHAPTRRGNSSAHAAFSSYHRSSHFRGDSEDFGVNSAILAGDLLFSAAESAMIRQCENLSHFRDPVMQLYARMHAEVAIGQFLDISAEQRPLDINDSEAINASTALTIVSHKAANYSVVIPATLGALAMGASPFEADALGMVLNPWGHAFQLRDDELGVFGDPQITGKGAGDDLREGKRTYLLALTWQSANASEREKLARGLGNPEMTANQLDELRDIVARRGRKLHEEVISTFEAQGFLALESSRFTPEQRDILSQVAAMLIKRSK